MAINQLYNLSINCTETVLNLSRDSPLGIILNTKDIIYILNGFEMVCDINIPQSQLFYFKHKKKK